jgi:xylulose-5-phosphate/fructose-6-phosphate phosphoketolase
LSYIFYVGGFPSHVNAETPGAIHEGGELGYALAVAYGSIMDKPDLIALASVNFVPYRCLPFGLDYSYS